MPYIHKLYEVDYKNWTIKRKNKTCPRCGSFMAFHKQPAPRWHCGKCSYVEYVKK
ncbi:MAG: 30S ribosomal protein S27ae [Desulfurococcaceae archaeon]|nr:30S ribosomal protein S27ae [Desulfurococcaceae archaeon]MCC6054848.1 30S ribosomal protein S27ae [Thermosphaera sp.]